MKRCAIGTIMLFLAACGIFKENKPSDKEDALYISRICAVGSLAEPGLNDILLPKRQLPPTLSTGDDIPILIDGIEHSITIQGAAAGSLANLDLMEAEIKRRIQFMQEISAQIVQTPRDIHWKLAVAGTIPVEKLTPLFERLYDLKITQLAVVVDVTASADVPELPEDADKSLLKRPVFGEGDSLLNRIQRSCEAVTEVFNAMAAVPPEQRCKMLQKELPSRLMQDECQKDRTDILTILRIISVPNTVTADIPLRIVQDTTPSSATTWDDLVKRNAASGSIQFSVAKRN